MKDPWNHLPLRLGFLFRFHSILSRESIPAGAWMLEFAVLMTNIVTVGWEAGVFALDVERRGVAGIGFSRDLNRPRQGFYWIADEHAASIARCIWPFADDRCRL